MGSDQSKAKKAGKISNKAKTKTHKYRIPAQFKAERAIEDGAFFPWVSLAMKWVPSLTKKDLEPTDADLKLISTLAYQSDDLGNALADEILKNGLVANQLEQGLVKGWERLENPSPVLVEYLKYYEALPAYLGSIGLSDELNIVNKKGEVGNVPHVIGDGVAMSVGFFVGANYPAVGKSIVSTGSVASGSTRMIQTLKFVEDVYQPHAFELYGVGVQACAKVRLAHAFARKQIARKNDWDENYYGVPISEFDNMIFLSGIFMSVVLRGQARSKVIEAKVRGMQYGLGAPKALLDLSTMETFRFFNMCLAHLDDSPETARQVVSNFHDNEYFRETNTLQGKLNREISLQLANLTSRVLYGNTMADDIGLGRWYRGVYLPWLANYLRQLSIISVKRGGSLIKVAMRARSILKKISRKPRIEFAVKSSKENLVAGYTGSYGAFKGNAGSK